MHRHICRLATLFSIVDGEGAIDSGAFTRTSAICIQALPRRRSLPKVESPFAVRRCGARSFSARPSPAGRPGGQARKPLYSAWATSTVTAATKPPPSSAVARFINTNGERTKRLLALIARKERFAARTGDGGIRPHAPRRRTNCLCSRAMHTNSNRTPLSKQVASVNDVVRR